MAVKIKLKRVGKVHAPQYRVIVADSRTKRDGRAIEEIGIYQPMQDPSLIQISSERAQYWLSVGAQPTEAVLALLKVTGDWQKYKGLPGAEGTLRVAEPTENRKAAHLAAFEAAAKDAADEAANPKPKPVLAAPKAEAVAEEAVADAVEEAAVEEAAAEVVAEAEEIVEAAEAVEAVEAAEEAAVEEAAVEAAEEAAAEAAEPTTDEA